MAIDKQTQNLDIVLYHRNEIVSFVNSGFVMNAPYTAKSRKRPPGTPLKKLSSLQNDDQSQFSGFSFSDPSFPLRRYFSRRHSSTIHTKDLPYETSVDGFYTPVGIFFMTIKLSVPIAYIYICFTLMGEICDRFPTSIKENLIHYLPRFSRVIDRIHNSSTPFLDSWAILEALFYIFLIIKLQYLNYKCPLEASLSSAPLLELHERQTLWDRVMKCEKDDYISFITGWFFDEKLDNISRYDVRDFIAWSMFDARNQEHLSAIEVRQLNLFMNELETGIGIQLYGAMEDEPLDEMIKKKLVLDPSGLKSEGIEIEVLVNEKSDGSCAIDDSHEDDKLESLSSESITSLSLSQLSDSPVKVEITKKKLPKPRKSKFICTLSLNRPFEYAPRQVLSFYCLYF